MDVLKDEAREPEAELWTIDQAVKRSGIKRTKLYDLLREKQIKGKKVGKRTMLRSSSIMAVIDSLPDWTPQQAA